MRSNGTKTDLLIKEDQLTWLVYIIGGVIGGRLSYNTGNTEEHDLYDGELVVRLTAMFQLYLQKENNFFSFFRVLQLMNFLNDRLEHTGCEKLDLAMLNFFEQFRKIFIGDQVQKSSKVYRRMSELLGIIDETMLLNVIIRKM